MNGEECMGMMKRILTFIFGFLTLAFVSTVAPIASQQSQTNAQAESKSFVYKNIRITVTERGVVAGDLQTGKVIWRREFSQVLRNEILLEETRFFDETFFYRVYTSSPMTPIIGYLIDVKTGKEIVRAFDFYLKEENKLYFNGIYPPNDYDKFFADIVILEFGNDIKNTKRIRFSLDKYLGRIESYCYTPNNGVRIPQFNSKQGNVWNFTFSDKKCGINLSFDYTNISQFSITVKRKNK